MPALMACVVLRPTSGLRDGSESMRERSTPPNSTQLSLSTWVYCRLARTFSQPLPSV